MKKVLFFAVMLLLGLTSLCAQSSNDSIIIEKAVLGHRFFYNGLEINSKQMKEIVANDKEALKQMKIAGVEDFCSLLFVSVGASMVGSELGVLITNGKFMPGVLAIGGGVMGLGFLFTYLTDNRWTKAASIYNGNLGVTSYGGEIKYDFGLVPGGVGLTLSF